MKYGSVCSGVEAATAAWHPLGWKPQWFSEIEKFPSAVLAHHYPDVPNLGDMTQFKEWPIDRSIDLLVGGTPCQSFSVAGLRKGLDDPRGNLMLTYLAIAAQYQPKWLVWENVPGILSSQRGRDFGTFLGALGQLGYGFAYRVLDAQYFGVAQRRRRVFVVGYIGDWRRAAAVLFERESMSGHPPPIREAGQKVAPTVTQGAPFSRTGNDRVETDAYVAKRLTTRTGAAYDPETETLPIAFSSNMSVPDCQTDGSTPTVKVGGHGGGNPPAVCWPANVASTLNAAFGSKQGLEDQHINGGAPLFVPSKLKPSAVRRLTPTECERLQGFPDNFTQIPWRNKSAEDCPDGPRYKAMGNSMAVPVMRWIGERIEMVENLNG